MQTPSSPPPFDDLFAQLDDTRFPRLVYYPLNEVLFLVLIASLCGCDKLTAMVVFGEEKLYWLRQYYPYKHGIPSHDTLSRVLGMINKRNFELLFVDWIAKYFKVPAQTLLQIDGKHISGSANHQDKVKKRVDGGNYAEIIINVYASAAGISIAHYNISDSMDELKGALQVLDWLDVQGCCISGDSNFCRQKIVDKIIAKKADYLLALKGNAKPLYEAAQQAFADQGIEKVNFQTTDRAHGREEHRLYRAIDIEQLSAEVKHYFTQNQQLIEVTRSRHLLHNGKKTTDVHYYVTSLSTPVAHLAEVIRKHWWIENKLHYVLDVYFGEDASRVRQRNAASNLSLLRKMALNLHKRHPGKGSIKSKQFRCAISDQKRDDILKFMMR